MLQRIKIIVNKFLYYDNLDSNLYEFFFLIFEKLVLFSKLKLKATIKIIKSLKLFDDKIILKLKEEEISYTVAPKVFKEEVKSERVLIPALNLYLFEDVLVNPRSSCIVYKNNLIVESYFDNERFNEGFIWKHRYKNAFVYNWKEVTIEECFFLGGNGSFNWYHFMIELLPKLMFLSYIPCKTILVSEDVLKYPSMDQALKLLLDTSVM